MLHITGSSLSDPHQAGGELAESLWSYISESLSIFNLLFCRLNSFNQISLLCSKRQKSSVVECPAQSVCCPAPTLRFSPCLPWSPRRTSEPTSRAIGVVFVKKVHFDVYICMLFLCLPTTWGRCFVFHCVCIIYLSWSTLANLLLPISINPLLN